MPGSPNWPSPMRAVQAKRGHRTGVELSVSVGQEEGCCPWACQITRSVCWPRLLESQHISQLRPHPAENTAKNHRINYHYHHLPRLGWFVGMSRFRRGGHAGMSRFWRDWHAGVNSFRRGWHVGVSRIEGRVIMRWRKNRFKQQKSTIGSRKRKEIAWLLSLRGGNSLPCGWWCCPSLKFPCNKWYRRSWPSLAIQIRLSGRHSWWWPDTRLPCSRAVWSKTTDAIRWR